MIDFHIHNKGQDYHAVKNIVSRSEKFGIKKSVLLGDVLAFWLYPTEDQVKQINDWTIDILARIPDKLLGFAFLNPANSSEFTIAEFERCRNAGLRGVKIEAGLNCKSKKLDIIMNKVAEYDMPVLHHCWNKSNNQYPEESNSWDIAELAGRFPQVKIITAHLSGIRERGVRDIMDYPNVYVDTSGCQPISGILEYAVEMLGEDRIIFGSDAYGRNGRDVASQLGRVTGSRTTATVQEKILKTNAEKLLKL
jgi:predicted TIM-barrel fold metal-dependent hydrolase